MSVADRMAPRLRVYHGVWHIVPGVWHMVSEMVFGTSCLASVLKRMHAVTRLVDSPTDTSKTWQVPGFLGAWTRASPIQRAIRQAQAALAS